MQDCDKDYQGETDDCKFLQEEVKQFKIKKNIQ